MGEPLRKIAAGINAVPKSNQSLFKGGSYDRQTP